jgi:hypothetical protein
VDNAFVGGGVPPDAIPALVNPAFVPAEGVTYMENGDIVLGAEIQGRFFAFPVKIMNFHEIANFSVEGERYAATWCPLAYSYVLLRNPRWKDTENARKVAFRVSGSLMDDNLVMFDTETHSLWPQLLAMAVVGPRTGDCLVIERNTAMTTWETWRRLHPETLVLSNQNLAETGVRPSMYDIDPYEAYHVEPETLHEPTHQDSRLKAKTRVLGVHSKTTDAAVILDRAVGQAMLGETPAVFFSDAAFGTTFGFENNMDGAVRTFEEHGLDDAGLPTFMDLESQSVWTLDGIGVEGPLTGRRLAQLPVVKVYWFVWSSLFPGPPIHRP